MVRILRMSSGAIVWALHFAATYGITALACARGSPAAVPWTIGIATVIGLACMAAIALAALRRPDFAGWLTVALAGLGSIAIAWETIAVFTVRPCV